VPKSVHYTFIKCVIFFFFFFNFLGGTGQIGTYGKLVCRSSIYGCKKLLIRKMFEVVLQIDEIIKSIVQFSS